METYRLFIAAEVPPDVTAQLAAAQAYLRRDGAAVKWVAPELMHLALHFLGETDVDLVPQLGAALRGVLADQPAITLRLSGAGAFPNLRRPRVVWAGVGGAISLLERAHSAAGAALDALGLPRETRPFRPHLTLGRVRREATPAQLERLSALVRSLPPLAPTPWVVERIVLFRSQLRPAGPIYTELDAVKLL
jgi:RNA 2',3'-cyclic 3'-phosphodiesterase